MVRYSPKNHFGWCSTEAGEVFFHARGFLKLRPSEPGPVYGEPVVLEVQQGERGLRSNKVSRTAAQALLEGNVKSYDSTKGWGFLRQVGSDDIFFHKGDFSFPWVPVIGSAVTFYLGESKGKPRACWVNPVG